MTKMEWSIKKKEQIWEKFMKHLLNGIQDSKREMKEKLNQVVTQTKKVTLNQFKMLHHHRKIKVPLGQILTTTVPSWKKPKMQN